MAAPAYSERLGGIDAAGITGRAALARLSVLRKADLPALRKASPPYGGLVSDEPGSFGSPHPIFEPEPFIMIPGAGRRRCSRQVSGGRYRAEHLQVSPDARRPHFRRLGARAGLRGDPAGPGNADAQFQLIEAYRPIGYSDTPDFLKILLDGAAAARRDVSSIRRALVSGAAFSKSLQDEMKSRGVDAYQAFRTADLGLIAFETTAREGMVVNEALILEIVRPGTAIPSPKARSAKSSSPRSTPHHPWLALRSAA